MKYVKIEPSNEVEGLIKYRGKNAGTYSIEEDGTIVLDVTDALMSYAEKEGISNLEKEIFDASFNVFKEKVLEKAQGLLVGLNKDGEAVIFDAEPNEENRKKALEGNNGIVEVLN